MVLIGPIITALIITALIIIAVVLKALLVLGVPGIRWKPPARTASRRARPGSARIPGR
jgi:hypothetical protein